MKKPHQKTQLTTAITTALLLAGTHIYTTAPAYAAEDPITATISAGYCQNNKMNIDYTIQNNTYPTTAHAIITENNITIKEENIPQNQTSSGTVTTNQPIGATITIKILVDNQQIGFERTTLVKNCLPEPTYFNPTEPTFNDPEGTSQDSVTIPEYPTTTYTINNTPTTAGTHPASGTTTVKATPTNNYQFYGPQEKTWTHTYTTNTTEDTTNIGNEDDIYGLPTPNVIFDTFKNKKVLPKNKKTCKKLIKARDNLYDGKDLNKKQYKTLKTKCKIKKPKIYGSNKKTKMYEGIPYSWGVKPVTTGGTKGKIDITYGRTFPDNVTAADPEITENIFTKTGKLLWINQIGGKYYFYSLYYKKNKLAPISDTQDQPLPAKQKTNNIIDTQIQQLFCNNSTEHKSVTIGIKTQNPNPQIIVERTIALNPSECRMALTSESAGLPPVDDEARPGTIVGADRYFARIHPNKTVSLQYRHTKKAIYYYRVNSTNYQRYYQRSILTAQPNKQAQQSNTDKNPPRYIDQQINRGW